MSQILANGGFCKCSLAHTLHPPCWLGTPTLAQYLPAPKYSIESRSTTTPCTTARAIEEAPKAETASSVITAEDEDDDDEEEQESIRIRLLLSKSVDITADVDRDAPNNWISEKLLGDSGVDVVPAKYVTYQALDGMLLESKGRVRVYWCRSVRDKVFPGEFMVHAGKRGAPDIILGKSWAQTHGESVPRRQSKRGRRGEVPRIQAVSSERQKFGRRGLDTPRR